MHISSITSFRQIINGDVQIKYTLSFYSAACDLQSWMHYCENPKSIFISSQMYFQKEGSRRSKYLSNQPFKYKGRVFVFECIPVSALTHELMLPSTSRLCPVPSSLPIRQQVIGYWLLRSSKYLLVNLKYSTLECLLQNWPTLCIKFIILFILFTHDYMLLDECNDIQ